MRQAAQKAQPPGSHCISLTPMPSALGARATAKISLKMHAKHGWYVLRCQPLHIPCVPTHAFPPTRQPRSGSMCIAREKARQVAAPQTGWCAGRAQTTLQGQNHAGTPDSSLGGRKPQARTLQCIHNIHTTSHARATGNTVHKLAWRLQMQM